MAKALNQRIALFKSFFWREFSSQYLTSTGGLLWSVVLPLALLGIYAFVFTRIFEARVPGWESAGFIPFLAVAFWPWIAFSESLSRAASAITDNEAIIGKIAMPHEVLVLARVAATFALNVFGYVAVLLVLLATGTELHLVGILGSLVVLLQLLLLAAALGLIVGATQVYVRDIGHALPPILTLWFFASPILYGPELIPSEYRDVFAANPMFLYSQQLREMWLNGSFYFPAYAWLQLLLILLLFAAAWFYFQRLSQRFEDYL